MTTYVMRDGKLIEKRLAGPRHNGDKSHYVISDTMQPMRHPITGKLMDSKSKFRAITRANNCVEVGNEVMRDTRQVDPVGISWDIAHAIKQLGG